MWWVGLKARLLSLREALAVWARGSLRISWARRGRVAIGDVNAGLGSELAAKLGKDKAVFIGADVTDPAQCADAVDAAWKEFGSLDYLVNSAIAINGGELIDLPLDKWRATIDIGLTGTFHMGQAFARRMVSAKRKGAVVNLSSVSAFHPYGGSGAYSTVKAAIIHLTELMAIEWAPRGAAHDLSENYSLARGQ